MKQEIILYTGGSELLALITREREKMTQRFLEFFTANIRNKNTRFSYARAVGAFFAWCDKRRQTFRTTEPMIVAAYIEDLTKTHVPQAVRQHRAAIRTLFDWLVVGQIIPFNPASSVRGPRYSIKKGVLHQAGAREAEPPLRECEV